MRDLHVCGLGSAITDLFVELTEEEFSRLGFVKGTSQHVTEAEQLRIIQQLGADQLPMISGGSTANSVIALSQLGSRCAFIAALADDQFGQHYRNEFGKLGIEVGGKVVRGAQSGTCLILVTPDAERTMLTSLAASSCFNPQDIDVGLIQRSSWLFTEGYLLAQDNTRLTLEHAIELAGNVDCKVALSLSDAGLVSVCHEVMLDCAKRADFIFANEEEALALTWTKSVDEAFSEMRGIAADFLITRGSEGAVGFIGGRRVAVEAFPCTPIDLTGAGDMFAGAVMHGLLQGMSADHAVRAACFMAMKIITQIGARLHHAALPLWQQAVDQPVAL